MPLIGKGLNSYKVFIFSFHAKDYNFFADQKVPTQTHNLELRNTLSLLLGTKVDFRLIHHINRANFSRGENRNLVYNSGMQLKVKMKYNTVKVYPEIDVDFFNFTNELMITSRASIVL